MMFLSAMLVLNGLLVCSAVIVRDYNAVNFYEVESFDQFREKFMNLDTDVFTQNVMLGVATPECWDKLQSPAFRGTQRHSGGGPLATVSLPAAGFPYPSSALNKKGEPDACAHVLFYRIGDNINDPTAVTSEFEHRYLNQWLAERMRLPSLRMTNGFDFPIDVYWQEESTDPVHQGTLEPGESIGLSSFIGHVFSASSLDPLPEHDNDPENDQHPAGFRNVIDYFVVEDDEYTFSPVNRLETCEIVEGAKVSEFVDPDKPLDCSNMYLRLLDFTHSVFYAKRLGLNFVQPQFVRQVTPTGFEHRQLPPATYQWLKRYAYSLECGSEGVFSVGDCDAGYLWFCCDTERGMGVIYPFGG